MSRTCLHGAINDERDRLKSIALAEYREVCRRKGVVLPLPQPFHSCTQDCAFYECRGIRHETVFVCKKFLAVHVCGSHCQCHEVMPQNEGTVCVLTGRVLPHFQLLQNNYCRSKTNPAVNKNGHYQRGLDRLGKRRRIRQPTTSTTKLYAFVDRAYGVIMESPERKKIFDDQCVRFSTELKRIVRQNAEQNGGYVNIITSKTAARTLVTRFGQFLNPPAQAIASATRCKVIRQLTDYIAKFTFKLTYRNVLCLVACILQKLANGMTIRTNSGVDVCVIQKEAFFAQHVPHEVTAGLLPGLSCRSMSTMQRIFQRQLALSNGEIRIEMRLKLTA